MLELRPNCEHCGRDLPADSTEAMICSYECTFCRECVAAVLQDVCPNCAGGFSPRPVRPARAWRPGVSVVQQPPSERRVDKPVDAAVHAALVARLAGTAPAER